MRFTVFPLLVDAGRGDSAFRAPGTATADRAECSRLLARCDSEEYDDGAIEADYVRIVEYAKLIAQS